MEHYELFPFSVAQSKDIHYTDDEYRKILWERNFEQNYSLSLEHIQKIKKFFDEMDARHSPEDESYLESYKNAIDGPGPEGLDKIYRPMIERQTELMRAFSRAEFPDFADVVFAKHWIVGGLSGFELSKAIRHRRLRDNQGDLNPEGSSLVEEHVPSRILLLGKRRWPITYQEVCGYNHDRVITHAAAITTALGRSIKTK
ncbi:MAG: hypothetical protein Q9166_007454 [cf. Caloplaca sp. 2 TL-2023]